VSPTSEDAPRLADLKRIGEGREAEIFAWGEGSILRLLRQPGSGEGADRQLAAMTAAWEAGFPVPTPGPRIDVEGRSGIVMERVEGPDLLTLMGRRPWTVLWVARTLGTSHASLHDVPGPSTLPTLRESLGERIGLAEALPRRQRDEALRVLEDLPDGDRLCHGDFHPGNLLRSPRGPVAIDWTLASRGHPTGDFARQPLMLSIGEVPPGTHPLVRFGERYGRGVFLRTYMRTYRRARAVDDANWSGWQVVQAAARFAEGIEGEFPALLRFLELHSSG
jgi:aminoglycoside phosphotransferase (APT) family kinase protein